MKAKKKPLGMKHKILEERKREERMGLAIIVAILVTIIFVSGFVINLMLNQPSPSQTVNSTSELKAAIVDQLSLSRPNQTFVETATNTLKQAGYTVDYYPGEQVTVEFYRKLPINGYGIIILRVHSTAKGTQNGEPIELPVLLFTSELYSTTKYVYEQLTDQIYRAGYTVNSTDYFAIAPNFVSRSMNGRLKNATIIMMGCEGLNNTIMAEALVEKGAKAYIGWDDDILGIRNDPAIMRLLQRLISERKTVEKAVDDTMKEFGPSSTDNSVLRYYPLEAGGYTIQDIVGSLITN